MPLIMVLLLAGLVVALAAALVVGAILVLRSNRNLVELILDYRQQSIQRRDSKRAEAEQIEKFKEELGILRNAIHQQAREAGGGQLSERLAEDKRRRDLEEEVSELDIGTAGRRTSRRLG